MHYYNSKYADKYMFGTTEWALLVQKHHVLPHITVNGSYPYYHAHLILTRMTNLSMYGDDKLQSNTERKYDNDM